MERPELLNPVATITGKSVDDLIDYALALEAERDTAQELAECHRVMVERNESYYQKAAKERDQARADAERLAEALQRINVDQRSDGTYTLSRQACQKIAAEAYRAYREAHSEAARQEASE